MTAITKIQAICCLLNAAQAVALDVDPDGGFHHRYHSPSLTWPYCGHDAAVAAWLGRTTTPPPGPVFAEADDAHAGDRMWYDRFALHALICGPAVPTAPGECIDGLYGPCDSDDPATLSGHGNTVLALVEAIEAQLLANWCACMAALTGVTYSRSWPMAFEAIDARNEGRFAVVEIELVAQIR